MQEYFSILKKVPLFANINDQELADILSCVRGRVATAGKGEIILHLGDTVSHVGIVLDGRLLIAKEDHNGERMIISALSVGDLFAEALCCAGESESPVSVTAETNATILFIEFKRIIHNCPKACTCHTTFIENMLGIIAQKNLLLQKRLDCVGKKTMREKILSYLESFCNQGGSYFSIPYNREELADFLCVDRSALSHELSRMKKQGLIDYQKNHFKLL